MGDDLTHFGAFNHSNIGDRLYGVLLPMLTGREFRRAALQRQETPDFSVEAIDDCRGPVIVGGGDIFATTAEYQGFMGPLPPWPQSLHEGFRMRRRAVYMSVGVPSRVNAAQDGWIWARDNTSAVLLPAWPDVIAPDLAVLSSQVIPKAASSAPVAIVQTAYPDAGTETVIRQLQRAYEVRIISLTHYNGDQSAMQAIATRCGLTVHRVETALEMLATISAASLVIASSMHANIVAFSYGVPHLMAPTPAMTKMSGFLEVAGLPRFMQLQAWKDYTVNRLHVEAGLVTRAQSRAREALAECMHQAELL